MPKLRGIIISLLTISQLSCYSPPQVSYQNEFVATYQQENFQTIEFLKKKETYRVSLLLYNEFQKRQHLIDPKIQKWA